MKKLYKVFSSLILATFMLSCSSTEIPAFEPDLTTMITYEKDVKNIISNSCATVACHDAVSPAAGLPLTNFTQIKNAAENGNLVDRMNSSSNPMPPAGLLPAATRNIINQWKADGFLEN